MNQAQEKMSAAAAIGFAALQYVTEPERWPGFAAWAEQKQPGSTWDEADRLAAESDSRLLWRLSETLESL